jgi:autotransporter-associated beta strand protein
MKSRLDTLLAATPLFLAALSSQASATTVNATWYVDANGAWNDALNWNPGIPGATDVSTSPDTAVFGSVITAATAITVDAGRNLSGIDFSGNSFAYTLSEGSLVLTSGGIISTSGAGTAHTDTIATPITLAGDGGSASFAGNSTTNARILFISGSVTGAATSGTTTLTLDGSNTGSNRIDGAISNGANGGALTIVKNGAGTWILGGTNTFSGGITINSGELGFGGGANGQAGAGTITLGATSGSDAARLRIVNSNMNLINPLVVAAGSTGVKTLAANTGGVGSPNFNGPITLNDSLTVVTATGGTSNQTFTLGGSGNLDLTSKTLTLSLAPSGTSNTGAITVSKPITGAGSIVIAGTGASTGTRTVTLSGTNSYTGGTTVGGAASGTTTALTVNVNGDQSAATGGWAIDNENGTATANSTVNFNSGSTVVVASSKSIGIGGTSGNLGTRTLNASGTVTNDGTLWVRRASTLNVNGTWTQNGSTNVTSQGGGQAALKVNSGATFTYTSPTQFRLDSSTSVGFLTNLTVTGGTFITGVNFRNNTTTNSAGTSANLILTGGGTLRLTADVPQLITSAGATSIVQVGTNGGTIDTNGFSTNLDRPVVNVASQTGSLTKAGAGTLTLTGANSYSGDTTVAGGTLAVAGTNFADTSSVTVATGATLHLNFAGSDTITGLTLGSTVKGPGTYNATNSPGFITGTGSLVIPGAADPFTSWIDGFASLTNPADKEADADPDKDGLPNLLEFAFDGDPASAMPTGKMVTKIANVAGDNCLVLTLPVRAGATFAGSGPLTSTVDKLDYAIEGSANLATFNLTVTEVTPALSSGLPALSGPGWEYRSFRLATPVTSASAAFLRAKVTSTP